MLNSYAPPHLLYEDVIEEFDAVIKAAAKLLAPNATQISTTALEELRQSRIHGQAISWQVSKNNPIKTMLCGGQYHPKNNGQYDLEGRLSFVWDLKPQKEGKKKTTPAKFFSLTGNVSTRIEIWGKLRTEQQADLFELGSWRFEMGCDGHPGAFFHGQFDWKGYPGIDIPRLPSILLSPAECIDFLLGELFQTKWPETQQSNKDQLNRWAKRHRTRIHNLLGTVSDVVKNSTGVSPWIALKQWHPSDASFLVK